MISRCIETNTEKSGDEQVVQYIRGVGTSYSVDRWLGGWLGLGLTTSIQDAYRWLVLNYLDFKTHQSMKLVYRLTNQFMGSAAGPSSGTAEGDCNWRRRRRRNCMQTQE